MIHLAGRIDQLKRMFQMPLLYLELFLQLDVVPSCGVLFHGLPDLRKTLLQ
jgi:ATP-dependent 26S proteasome regulatory subunit